MVRKTNLGADVELSIYGLHSGLNENIGDEQSNIGFRSIRSDGTGDVGSKLDSFVLGLRVKLPVPTDEGLSAGLEGSGTRKGGGGSESSGRTEKRKDRKGGELHFYLFILCLAMICEG
jgi:hypothetical protein